MRISVVTVSRNGEATIGRTIESVLDQTWYALPGAEAEYLIIDGQSTDRTLAIAEGYREAFGQKGIRYRIVSEPDGGIYDAMNKGIRLATGDIIGIINSDDWYEPRALQTAAETFQTTGCELMYTDIRLVRPDGGSIIKRARLRHFETSRDWNHPTMFVRAALYKQYPFRNLGIHDDYGFFLRMKRQKRRIAVLHEVTANFRMGGASNRKSLAAAGKRVADRYRYCYRINGYSRWYMIECVAIEAAKWIFG